MATHMQTAIHTKQILRRKHLEALIGLSRSTIYSRLDPESPHFDADFPKPINLGSGKNPPVGWLQSEVETWLDAQITASRKAA